MFLDFRKPLPEFVREILPTLGAETEEHPDGVTLVLLPGESEIRRVTFEMEVAREDERTEWVAIGSRFVETLTRLAFSQGRIARAFSTPFLRPPPALNHAYHLQAEQWTHSRWVESAWTTWVFAFGVQRIGEFRREALFLVAVDAASLRLVRRFEESFARLNLEDKGPEPLRDRPFGECYAAAREELMRKEEVAFNQAQRESGEALEREMVCLARYYGGLLLEGDQDLARTPSGDPRQAAVLSRIQATRRDRDRTVAQTRERYRLSRKAEVIGVLGVVYPRQVATLTLSNKSGPTAQTEATWDPVFERFDPLACPSCRKPTYTVEFNNRILTCGNGCRAGME